MSQHEDLLRQLPNHPGRILHIGTGVDKALVSRLPGVNDTAASISTVDSMKIGYYDAIVLVDVFEQDPQPRKTMTACARFLRDRGLLVSSFLNAQFGMRLNDLLLGDDVVEERMYTVQGFFRALLDAGYTPRFMGGEKTLNPPDELVHIVKKQGERGQALIELMQMLRCTFIAEKLPPISSRDYEGLALLVCTNNERVFRNNLETSAEFNSSKHERYVVTNPSSPAEVFELARKKSKKKLLTFMHHDLYIPAGWGQRIWTQFWEEDRKSPVGVAGLFGVRGNRSKGERNETGSVIDLLGLRTMAYGALPCNTRVIDGLSFTVKRQSTICPDPELGFHFYDADVCMQAEEAGSRVIALEAPALHSSFVILPPPPFAKSREIFARKWAHRLPVETPCALVE